MRSRRFTTRVGHTVSCEHGRHRWHPRLVHFTRLLYLYSRIQTAAMVNTRFFSLSGTMTTGRGNGSYGGHRLGTCPGFFPVSIYRTVTTDAAGWESASVSSRGSTTCSRLWDATGWESTPSSAYDRTRRGQRRKGDVPVWASTPAVPTTRLAEVNDASTISRFGNLLPAVPTTRRAKVSGGRKMSRFRG
jgi:hypothetical protein